MPREGRLLEVMVHRLEQFLAPDGVLVTSPEKFLDDQGRQIGEIDVTLRGDFGSSQIFVGIECRDRPSDKRQGRGWIREIKAKRDDLKVDKMIAVSTTGFTRPAIDLANSWGIDLLAVEDIAKVPLADWFKLLDFVFHEESWDISGTLDITTIPTTPPSISTGALLLRSDTLGAYVHIREYVRPHLDRLFAQLGTPTVGVQQLNTTLAIPGPVPAQVDGKPILIERIQIPLTISREVVATTVLLNACRRLGNDEVVGLTGACRLKTRLRECNVLVAAKKGHEGNSLRLTFLDENWKPYNLPAGTRFTLYGRQDQLAGNGA